MWRRIAVLIVVCCLSQAAFAQKRSAGRAKKGRPTTAAKASKAQPFTIESGMVNDPQQQPIRTGARGSSVVRAQILLTRAHFSSGIIDGVFGQNLQKTVTAFQKERNLPESGSIDQPTWDALHTDQAPALVEYRVTEEDLKGPFTEKIPSDMMEQAKLPAMNYTTPLEYFSERFHASPEVLQKLNPGADFNKADTALQVPNILVMPPGPAAKVVVSKSESSVRAYDADGKLLAFYVATIGSENDPLPVGEWKILGVSRNPVFNYNPKLFWDAKEGHSKATIKAGPNNPVGVVWIDLSKEHYGIHGTPEPSKVGHTTSHGCIRLTNWDAWELASLVKPNTPATLQE